MQTDLAQRSLDCLLISDPEAKCAGTAALRAEWLSNKVPISAVGEAVQPVDVPGRPERPMLVAPQDIGRRSIHTREGHAALIHALAHIEFNAINLALDAVYRFRGLPQDYYSDWLQVVAEEAYHFSLLREHLRTLNHDYGDFPAHDGLWQMCRRTAHDPLVRMALVPRLLEARGLDANPSIVKKLNTIGDARGVEILEIILRDEIGHVRIGNRWYEYFCSQRRLDPASTFQQLLMEYDAPRPRPPLNAKARKQAGFEESELLYFETGR